MPQLPHQFCERILDYEEYLYSLIREQRILQGIEDVKPDFADLAIAHELVSHEIDEIRHKLRQHKTPVFEEEEEEVDLSSKYNIEHLVEDKHGNARKAAKSDFDMDNNPYVRSAFKVIMDWYIRRDEDSGKRSYQ